MTSWLVEVISTLIKWPLLSVFARKSPPKSTSKVALPVENSLGAICGGAKTHVMPLSSSTLAPESVVSTVSATSWSGIVKAKTVSVSVLAAASFSHCTPEPVTKAAIFHVGGRTVTVIFVPAVAEVALANATTSSAASTVMECGTAESPSPRGSSRQAARPNVSARMAIARSSVAMNFLFKVFPPQAKVPVYPFH